MQTLKVDLNPNRDLPSVKVGPKSKKNSNGDVVSSKDQSFLEALQQFLSVDQTPTIKAKVRALISDQEQKGTKTQNADGLLTSDSILSGLALLASNQSPILKNEAEATATGNKVGWVDQPDRQSIICAMQANPEADGKKSTLTSPTNLYTDVSGKGVSREDQPYHQSSNGTVPAQREADIKAAATLTIPTYLYGNASGAPSTSAIKLTMDAAGKGARRVEQLDPQGINSPVLTNIETDVNTMTTSTSPTNLYADATGKVVGWIGQPDPKSINDQIQTNPAIDVKVAPTTIELTADAAGQGDSQIDQSDPKTINGKVQIKPVKDIFKAETIQEKTEVTNHQNIVGNIGLTGSNDVNNSVSNSEKTALSQPLLDSIVSKIVQQAKVTPSSMEISLKPEYLGKVKLFLQSNEGQISIKIIAHSGETVNLLNSNLQNIRESLEQLGVKLQQMDVDLANQEKQGNQTGSGGREQAQQQSSFAKPDKTYANINTTEQISSLPYKLNLLA